MLDDNELRTPKVTICTPLLKFKNQHHVLVPKHDVDFSHQKLNAVHMIIFFGINFHVLLFECG